MTDDAIRLDAHKDEFHRDQQWHKPVRCAATGNVTIATGLNAGDTIDGETLAAGDRVLLPAQSTASQNGIYVVRASPGRAYDMLTGLQVMGSFVYVIDGTANGGKLFRNTNLTMPTVGVTSLTFEEFAPGGGLDVGIALFQDHGTVGATETIDQSAAMAHWITLDVNCTLTFSGAVSTVDGDPVECSFRLYIEQDGSGGNTITWPGSVVWPGGVAPTLDTTASSVEVLDFTTPDGGTTWYGFHGGSAGAAAISIEDQGVELTATPTSIDFVGAGVTATNSGDDVTVTIPGVTESDVMDAGRWEVIVSGTGPPVAVSNPDDDDWLYAWVSG